MDKVRKVCVIDDGDIYQFLLNKELKSTQIVDKILVFSDGAKALEFMTQVKDTPEELPDIIFLDVNMPVMNKWEFLDEFILLRPRLSKGIVILIVSSSFDKRDIERAKQYAEVSDYIIQPVTRSNLVNVLRTI
ncbi:MAG: response regulator [Bacteroidetes bacterium]|nr:response regulator [Bacteroidota bacterium]